MAKETKNEIKKVNVFPSEGYLIQPSQVTFAPNYLDHHEKRVLYKIIGHLQAVIGKIQTSQLDIFGNGLDNETNTIDIPINELTTAGRKRYVETLESIESLRTKPFITKMYTTQNDKTIRLTQHASIISGYTKIDVLTKKGYKAAGVRITYSKELVERVFLNFDNGFTKYLSDVAFNLSNEYAMNFYEYISHFKEMKDPLTVSLETMYNTVLKLPEGSVYKKDVYNMSRRIIDKIQFEIKNLSPKFYFTYEKVIEDRKISKFKIYIHNKDVYDNISNTSYNSKNLSETFAKLLLVFGLNQKDFDAIFDFVNKPPDRKDWYNWRLKKLIELKLKNAIAPKNVKEYILKALKNDFKNEESLEWKEFIKRAESAVKEWKGKQ